MTKISHPEHYGGKDNPYEAIKVIEAWRLGFHLGNVLKYISRAGRKDFTLRGEIEDLEKAKWYLDRELERLKAVSERLADDGPEVMIEPPSPEEVKQTVQEALGGSKT